MTTARTLTITDPDWSHAERVRGWMDEEPQVVAEECADTEEAWWINNAGDYGLPAGWTYDPDHGSFTFPLAWWDLATLVSNINEMITDGSDWVVGHLDEIRANAG